MDKAITPHDAERKLIQLSKEVDTAHFDLTRDELDYYTKKAKFEISVARQRLEMGQLKDRKLTVSDKADTALVSNADLYLELSIAEAKVRGSRANANRIRTQVDIARSVGTSVRASLDIQ